MIMMCDESYTVVGILQHAAGGVGEDFVVVKEKRKRLLSPYTVRLRDATFIYINHAK